jgi:hypothetical protein
VAWLSNDVPADRGLAAAWLKRGASAVRSWNQACPPRVFTRLADPRYTGRQVWNRQRTDADLADLADPADVSLGHKRVQRWNLPDGWVISSRPAHEALVSEADFIAAQDVSAARGPEPRDDVGMPERRKYLLAGLLVCGTCGRRMESAWSNGRAAYRCRHGYTTAAPPDPDRPGNAFIREDRALAQLAALHTPLSGAAPAQGRRRRTRRVWMPGVRPARKKRSATCARTRSP